MISSSDLAQLGGATVVDSHGEKIGTAREVYLDDETGAPAWVTVSTGLFGTSESFLPLSRAELSADSLRVPFDKRTVTDAPHLGSSGHLTPEEEDELHRYYGGQGGADASEATGTATGSRTETRDGSETTTGSDLASDGAMTRSEERLTVGTERRETGRARLRKFVVTETVTVEVPVRREEVRLVQEPVGGFDDAAAALGTPAVTGTADAGLPYDGPPVDLADGEVVVVLHEERPVVTTETVAVERVRMTTEQVTGTEAVSAEVRTEHVEVDGDVADGPTDRS